MTKRILAAISLLLLTTPAWADEAAKLIRIQSTSQLKLTLDSLTDEGDHWCLASDQQWRRVTPDQRTLVITPDLLSSGRTVLVLNKPEVKEAFK